MSLCFICACFVFFYRRSTAGYVLIKKRKEKVGYDNLIARVNLLFFRNQLIVLRGARKFSFGTRDDVNKPLGATQAAGQISCNYYSRYF
jgi:hypothetical protein